MPRVNMKHNTILEVDQCYHDVDLALKDVGSACRKRWANVLY